MKANNEEMIVPSQVYKCTPRQTMCFFMDGTFSKLKSMFFRQSLAQFLILFCRICLYSFMLSKATIKYDKIL